MISSKIKLSILLFAAICLSKVNEVLGQVERAKKPKEFFLGIGSAMYQGDLSNDSNGRNLLVIAGIKMNTQKRLNGNFNLTIGSVSGQELDYSYEAEPTSTPNTFFKTSLIGVNFDLQYNLINKDNIKVYLSQGVGAVRYEPQDEFSKSLTDQSDTRALNEEYRNLTLMLPSMIGVKYLLPNGYGVTLQTGFYNTTTDYLDNISEWGNDDGGDNVFAMRLQVSVPLDFNNSSKSTN